MLDTVKFAIVGCGRIGKRHAEMIQQNPYAELVALADIRPKAQLDISTYSVDFFSSLEALLSAGLEMDVIIIATPNGLHFEQAKLALLADKHIVVEKPVTLKASEAKELIDLSVEYDKYIFPVMQNRYSPPAQWLKSILNNDLLGNIYIVQINCFWNRDRRYYTPGSWHGTEDLDGGTLYTQFSHFIDIMLWLFGDIKNINASFNDFNHQQLTRFEDSGFINFEFCRGGRGTFTYSTSVFDQNLESSLTIIAENGSVKIGGQYMDKVEVCHIRNYEFPNIDSTKLCHDYGTHQGSAQNHQFVIQNVVDVIRRGERPDVNAHESLKVIEVIENIYALKSN